MAQIAQTAMPAVVSPEDLAYAQNQGIGNIQTAAESRAANQQQQQMFSAMANAMSAGLPGRVSVPIVNQHEQQGRTGLVDPATNGQQTMIGQVRRMDQMKNFMAIHNSLPQPMQEMNQLILQKANQTPIGMQQYLHKADSLYTQPSRDFVTNRMNLELTRKRQNSMYALV